MWGRGLLGMGGVTGSPSGEVPAQHLPEILPVLPHLPDHGGLESAVHHAVGAAVVPFVLVLLPVGLGHELVECLVVGIGDEVAGSLPALGVEIGVPPGGALQLPLSLEIAQVHGRAEEAVPLRQLPDALELLVSLPLLQEDVPTLQDRVLISRGG